MLRRIHTACGPAPIRPFDPELVPCHHIGGHFATVNLGGYRFLLPGPEPTQVDTLVVGAGGGRGVTIRWATWAILLALGLIGVCGSIVEDSGGVLLERRSSNLTKSGDDTAQVVAHHGFGLLGLASAHRIDDRHVLG